MKGVGGISKSVGLDGVSNITNKVTDKIDTAQDVVSETQAGVEDTLDDAVEEAEERTSSIDELQKKMEQAKKKAEKGQVLEAAAEGFSEIGEATGNESLLGTGETVGNMIGAA